MLVRSIPGDCGFVLEHDVAQIAVATIKASAPVPASRKLRRSVISGFASGFQAAVEAAAPTSLRARASSPSLRHRAISSLRAT
jgi:predicted cation transporter